MTRNVLPKGDDLTARILSFLAADDDRLRDFLDTTGLTPETIRVVASTASFAKATVDYILDDDFRIMAFAAFSEVPPDCVVQLRLPVRLVQPARRFGTLV